MEFIWFLLSLLKILIIDETQSTNKDLNLYFFNSSVFNLSISFSNIYIYIYIYVTLKNQLLKEIHQCRNYFLFIQEIERSLIIELDPKMQIIQRSSHFLWHEFRLHLYAIASQPVNIMGGFYKQRLICALPYMVACET